MSDFYKVKAQMEDLVSGDIAKESLELAENDYLMFGDDSNHSNYKDSPEFSGMKFKDDDGNWTTIH